MDSIQDKVEKTLASLPPILIPNSIPIKSLNSSSSSSPPVLLVRPRIFTSQDNQKLNELITLINLAYTDAYWFKKPIFYDRMNMDRLLSSSYLKNESGFFIIITKEKEEGKGKGKENENDDKQVQSIVDNSNQESPNYLIASAYVSLNIKESSATLSLLSVHPEWQGKGLAKTLFQLIETHILKNTFQIQYSRLEVVSVQTHLFQIYEKFGYQKVNQQLQWKDIGIDPDSCISVPCHLEILQKELLK